MAMLNLKYLAVFEDFRNPFKDGSVSFGQALLIALVAILIVFAVLCLIIGSIKLLQLCVKKFSKKQENANAIEEANEPVEEAKDNLEIEDDDMMAAVLVATIDYANETKKDVKLKSVKRIG